LEPSTHYPESVRQWLTSPLGDALVQQEGRVVEEAREGMFSVSSVCSLAIGVNPTHF